MFDACSDNFIHDHVRLVGCDVCCSVDLIMLQITTLTSQSAFMLLERRDNPYFNVALRTTKALRIPMGPQIIPI